MSSAIHPFVRHVVEGQVEAADQGSQSLMVTNDSEEFSVELRERVSDQDVSQAMVFPCREDDDPLRFQSGELDSRVARQNVPEFFLDSVDVPGPLELGAHEEAVGGSIDEFLIADDVQSVSKENPSDPVDQTGFVGAFHEEYLGECQGGIHRVFGFWKR